MRRSRIRKIWQDCQNHAAPETVMVQEFFTFFCCAGKFFMTADMTKWTYP
jgi:hypothetical protein